jgi:hypothetical protein
VQAINDSNWTVCPSGGTVQPITKDLGRFREMPSFALSRRQRGFESRWGHKIKPSLTRQNAPYSCRRRRAQHELRERQGSGPHRTATTSSPLGCSASVLWLRSALFRSFLWQAGRADQLRYRAFRSLSASFKRSRRRLVVESRGLIEPATSMCSVRSHVWCGSEFHR